MPRPHTDRTGTVRKYSVYITQDEAEAADRLAERLGILNERGKPSRSRLFLFLFRDAERQPEVIAERLRGISGVPS